VISFGIISLVK